MLVQKQRLQLLFYCENHLGACTSTRIKKCFLHLDLAFLLAQRLFSWWWWKCHAWPVSENQALIIHSSHHFFLSFHISSLPLDETWTFWSIYITGQCCRLQPFWLIWQVHFGGKFWHLNFDLETTHFSLLQGGWVGWRIFAPDDHMVLRWDREGISHHWQSVKGDYTEKFLACKFSKKVAKLASQNIPYTYFMFTSYVTGK